MMSTIYDNKVLGEQMNFKTRLPKSFIGTLVSSLKRNGVEVTNIRDKGDEVIVTTSLCEVSMIGSWSVNDFKRKLRNEYYGFLNERFDKRVAYLKNKGYHYYKEFTCFAASEMSARNGNGIPNGVIMHEDDFLFYFNLEG